MLSLSDWVTTLSLVFGGCCSNAITMERLTKQFPHSGTLITFFQFLAVSLYGLPSQITFEESDPNLSSHIYTNGHANGHTNGHAGGKDNKTSKPVKRYWFPRLKTRRVPLTPYMMQVALFWVLSILNNIAFGYHIPMSVHIIFRSGGMVINMLLGYMFAKKRYSLTQVLSVFIVTAGIIMSTYAAADPRRKSESITDIDPSLYTTGIIILSVALVLSGFLGLLQDWVYQQYTAPLVRKGKLDSATTWQENMFYLHSFGLPLFYFSKAKILNALDDIMAGPPAPVFAQLPPKYYQIVEPVSMSATAVYLVLNTITQLLCVLGVNRMTGRVSSLTVTLILTVRKALSLLFSVMAYGDQGWDMYTGAALVFLGTIGYSLGGKSATPKPEEKKAKTE